MLYVIVCTLFPILCLSMVAWCVLQDFRPFWPSLDVLWLIP